MVNEQRSTLVAAGCSLGAAASPPADEPAREPAPRRGADGRTSDPDADVCVGARRRVPSPAPLDDAASNSANAAVAAAFTARMASGSPPISGWFSRARRRRARRTASASACPRVSPRARNGSDLTGENLPMMPKGAPNCPAHHSKPPHSFDPDHVAAVAPSSRTTLAG